MSTSEPAGWAFFDYDDVDDIPSHSTASDEAFCISEPDDAPSNEISRAYDSGISSLEAMDSHSALRLGILTDNKWENGKTLRVAFLGGSSALQSRVRFYASEWTRHANIKFQFVSGRYGDIRVEFTGHKKTSKSRVGTACLETASPNPTTWLGLDDNSLNDDDWIRRVTLHEFGHVLGCVHEHSQPNANITWNEDAVIRAHQRSPDPKKRWDAETVRKNIFLKYDSSQVQASSFDRYSIMLYPIPASWTYGTFSVGWNTTLSWQDIEFIKKVYPPSNPVPPPVRPPSPTRPPPPSRPGPRPPPAPPRPRTTNLCGDPSCGITFICAADYNRIVRAQGYPGV